MSWHADLPWAAFRKLYRDFRKAFFTQPKPSGPYIIVRDHSLDEIEQALGRQSFAPNWEFSYNYRGEDLNLAQVRYETDPEYDATWWQVHVRGWERDDYVELTAHWEMEPTENAQPHIDGVGLDTEQGMAELRFALDNGGITYG